MGAANAAVFAELLDIAVRVHMQMSRRGSLGPNEMRFKVRMFMHLQYATNFGVLHVGGPAMRAFAAAVDTFGVANVPGFRLSRESKDQKYTRSQRKVNSGPVCEEVQVTKPMTGCFRCPLPGHYANDKKFHPYDADGKRPPITDEDKKGILARIEAADRTSEEKAYERAQVKRYWLQHPL